MKRLTAVFLLIALMFITAINTYSLDISAQVYGGFNLLGLSTKGRPVELFNLNSGKVQIEASGTINNFGGWLRLGYDFTQIFFGEFDAWWNSSETFSLYITYKDDGHFALDNIAGSNYFGFPGDVLGLQGFVNGSHAFYSGFTRGAFVSYSPFEPITIYGGLNLFSIDVPEFMLKSMTMQLLFDFGSGGKLGLTAIGDYMTSADLNDNPNLYFYWNFATIDNLDIDIGVSYRIWDSRTTYDTLQNTQVVITRYHPVYLGIGAIYNGEKINFKTRLHVNFLGHDKIVTNNNVIYESRVPVNVYLDVLPFYSFSNILTGYLNAGIGLAIPDEGTVSFFWRLNPYIVIGNEIAAFYAGLDLNMPPFYPGELRINIAAGLSITF